MRGLPWMGVICVLADGNSAMIGHASILHPAYERTHQRLCGGDPCRRHVRPPLSANAQLANTPSPSFPFATKVCALEEVAADCIDGFVQSTGEGVGCGLFAE